MESARLEIYRAAADDLRDDLSCGKTRAFRRVRAHLPECAELDDVAIARRRVNETEAFDIVAREFGFENWFALADTVNELSDTEYAHRFERAAECVVDGEIDELREILEDDPSLARLRSPRSHGCTLLHYNCSNGVEDERQRVPDNAVEIAQLLFEHGADINMVANCYGGGPGSTALVGLVSSDHPNEADLMEDLVQAYAETGQSIEGIEEDGLPLSAALLFRNVPAAHVLVDCGATIHDIASAAGLGKLDLVKERIELGEEGSAPRATGPMPSNPFGWHYDRERAVELGLLLACTAGETEVVEYLLEVGVNCNAKLHHDLTPLHEAAWGGHADCVQLLLDAGANLGARDRQFSSTPIGWADHAGHPEIVAQMLSQGDVDIVDLVESGQLGLVRKRLEEDPKQVDGSDGSGVPLRTAAANGNIDMVKLLLEKGANVRLTNHEGRSALDWAEEHGHGDIAVLLWNKEREGSAS